MFRPIQAGLVAVALLVPASSSATHGGCVVHPAQTTCSNTFLVGTSASGVSAGRWEVSVIRSIQGVPTKVIVGGGPGGGAIATSPVGASVGERYTIEMFPAAGQPAALGVISIGNTAGHP